MLPLFDDATEQERETVLVLHEIDRWPVDYGKDLQHVRRMAKLYPKIDVYEEAVRFAAWMSEHKQKKEIKHRARFGNWCKRAAEFAVRRRSGTHRRPETEGHGDSVRASREW